MVQNSRNTSEPYDLSQLPSGETDEFEFKSSRIKHKDQLKDDISRAVSAFANSGGGTFVAGVDDNGASDGGLSIDVGNTNLLDWVDKVVHNVDPTPNYVAKLGTITGDRGKIDAGNTVLVIIVGDSLDGPCMAHDRRYYIRAGRHTEPARHFLVEAIWAKRHLAKPRIAHVVRPSAYDGEILQLGVVAVTDSPALDLEVALSHMPLTGRGLGEFPLHIEVIDRQNPLFFDISTRESVRRCPEEHRMDLTVTYHDLALNKYTYERTVDLHRSLSSLRFFHKLVDLEPIEKSLGLIADAMSGLGRKQRIAFPPRDES
jgi:hypothetical protein